MASNFYKIMSIIIGMQVLIFTNFSPTVHGKISLGHHVIHISNGLKPKQPPVRVRCQSKDDDLHMHTLYREQTYTFGFDANFWGTTRFFCHFYWKNNDISFDVFKAEDDGSINDKNCYWQVREDGFYHRCEREVFEDWVHKHSWTQL